MEEDKHSSEEDKHSSEEDIPHEPAPPGTYAAQFVREQAMEREAAEAARLKELEEDALILFKPLPSDPTNRRGYHLSHEPTKHKLTSAILDKRRALY